MMPQTQRWACWTVASRELRRSLEPVSAFGKPGKPDAPVVDQSSAALGTGFPGAAVIGRLACGFEIPDGPCCYSPTMLAVVAWNRRFSELEIERDWPATPRKR